MKNYLKQLLKSNLIILNEGDEREYHKVIFLIVLTDRHNIDSVAHKSLNRISTRLPFYVKVIFLIQNKWVSIHVFKHMQSYNMMP
jgi:hypothetical protein